MRTSLFLTFFVAAFLGGCAVSPEPAPIPFGERPMDAEVVSQVRALQTNDDMTVEAVAARYLYLQMGYSDEPPARLRATTESLPGSRVRVTIHDPSVRDDSIHETLDRITLRQESGRWIPQKHEWVHRGRGRPDWTTEPTL